MKNTTLRQLKANAEERTRIEKIKVESTAIIDNILQSAMIGENMLVYPIDNLRFYERNISAVIEKVSEHFPEVKIQLTVGTSKEPYVFTIIESADLPRLSREFTYVALHIDWS